MFKRLTILIVLFVVIFAVFLIWAQDYSQYEKLKDPQIRTMSNQKMLVAEAVGDPNVVAGAAFTKLFGTFFRLPGARMSPPRARFLNQPGDPRNEWVGLYALPLPDSVASLPPGVEGIKIDIWEYGEVAEILHIGAYSKETPTIERLLAFITKKGYRTAGPHEEEYVRGPESGPDSSKYMTIIRYQVAKN